LTRYRTTLIRERAQEVTRLQKVLETANLKLASVATDVLGASGRRMLEAILAGEHDPAVLAELARGRLRQKLPQLRLALEGRLQPHHFVLIERILAHVDFLEESLAALQAAIADDLVPVAAAVALLQTIPGIGERAATTIVAEIGTDMSRFPSAKHLASWAGLCPGNRESGGKRLGGKARPGDRWLKGVLGEVAWTIARSRDTYLSAQFRRIARRRGVYKAVVAVAHSVLVIVYHVLRTGQPYADLGPDYFDRLDADRLQRHHVHRLRELGFEVALTPVPVAAQPGFS
jgi:transposase